MTPRIIRSVVAGLTISCLACTAGRADSGQLSADRLNMLDQLGYFTPNFKAGVHDLVNSQHALLQAQADQAKLKADLPGLEKQAAEAKDKTAALREELARYEHPEETDFVSLQARMQDAAAQPREQIALAQAYVWTYPTSPHEGDAQKYLQQIQKSLADQQQAEKDAEAARLAAHQKLVQRAEARDLSLAEWRDFLRDMSQDDLLKVLGRPSSQRSDYWIYSGAWVTDPATNQKVGMEINFNAGRVLSVEQEPRAP